MKITDQVLAPLKDEHLILIGAHKKDHQKSDYHTHNFVGTTNLETGKMIHPTNKLNYTMAQRMADTIQKPVELVIEKKKKALSLLVTETTILRKRKISPESSIRTKTLRVEPNAA